MIKPWVEKWGLGDALDGGGQGETLLVPSHSNPDGVLKLLKKKADNKARRRMFQEVSNLKILAAAGAKVPNVLDSNLDKVMDLEVELYFVMEMVPGQTLAKLVSSQGGLSIEESIKICLALCDTLEIVIQEKIVHRDLKPENIMIRDLRTFDVVMLDFGISYHAGSDQSLTEHEEPFQNSLIRLPERTGIGEDKRDFRSDLTDICALLFYCLTNQPPRNLKDSKGNPPHKNVQSILSGRCVTEAQLRSLNLFFEKGLALEIESRFQSLNELQSRLREILSPATDNHRESLESIAARSRASLRQNDRKTKVAEFRASLRPQYRQLPAKLNHVSGKLTSFQFQLEQLPPTKNGPGDFIYGFSVSVTDPLHPKIKFPVEYVLNLEGNECTVTRSYVYPAKPPETTKRESEIIYRFLRPEEFPFDFLTQDVEFAVGQSLEHVTTAIINLSK